MLNKFLSFSLKLLLLVLVYDQAQGSEDNKIIYEKDYFQQFNITNAVDALNRIPGVENLTMGNTAESYDPTANNKKRGFGSSGTQILINGERQSSKSNSIIKTLERIQAESLIRIEVIRGSEAGLDVRSEGIIVNIIVDANSSKGSGTWSTSFRSLSSGDSIWSGSGSWANRIGNVDFVLGLERTGKINSRKYDEFHQDQNDKIAFYRVRETIEYEAKNRINLDKLKLMQAREINDEKIDQNEELAHLRADTAIEKSLISADVKLTSDKMKAKDVRTLKGPRS